jgi:aldose 1-epimerase
MGFAPELSVTSSSFGRLADGREVESYQLRCEGGVDLSVLTYGGIIQALRAPDRTGQWDNVALGFPDIAGYVRGGRAYFGAIVGRYANRIANARFTLDGVSYRVSANDGLHHLHGGGSGFDQKLWKARTQRGPDEVAVVLSHTSPAGDEGFPGALEIEVTYALNAAGVVRIVYRALTTAATVVNLTNHSLFNLAGESTPGILAHELTVDADRYTPVGDSLIPTGELAEVERTPLDFRTPTLIGARIGDGHPQLVVAGGYDHNFVLAERDSSLPVFAAFLTDPGSGRTLEVRTTEPGLQVYAGNQLDGTLVGTGGVPYARFAGIALETQRFPDSPNQPSFPSSVLRPGEELYSSTEFVLGVSRP